MSFAALLLKNLLPQPVRTGLTVLGISIGITTVVALGVVTESLKSSSAELIGDTVEIEDREYLVGVSSGGGGG